MDIDRDGSAGVNTRLVRLQSNDGTDEGDPDHESVIISLSVHKG